MRSGPGPLRPAERKSLLQSVEFCWACVDGFHSSVQHRVEERENWDKETKLLLVKANGRRAWHP